MFIGKTHYTWPCSINMFVYQRVTSLVNKFLKLQTHGNTFQNKIPTLCLLVAINLRPFSNRKPCRDLETMVLEPQSMCSSVRICFSEKTSVYLPSGNLTQLQKITIFYGKIHYKWSFSIAMFVYQRVFGISHSQIKLIIFYLRPFRKQYW